MTSIGKLAILVGLLLAGINTQLIPQYNPKVQDIQNKRDAWCRITNVPDNRYNATQQFAYRNLRFGIFSYDVQSVFNFYNSFNSNTWIQSQRWATGLLLVMIALSVISFIVFLVLCCIDKPKERSFTFMQGCIVLAWLLYLCFIGLFVVVIIFISMSEVAQRRSKCQLLNLGNMLISGYKNNQNGNNYVGLNTLSNALNSLSLEYPNLVNAVPSAQSVLTSNLLFWSQSALNSLTSVYLNNNKNTTVGTLGQNTKGYVLSTLSKTLNPAVGAEFNRLLSTSRSFVGAAQAVPNLSNNGNSLIVQQNIQSMNLTLNLMINDLADTTLNLWNNGWNRYTFSTGSYWAIFAVSIVVIVAIGIMLGFLNRNWRKPDNEPNLYLYKLILGILGFFLVWYAILVLILLAGSTSIATFCTVLSNINQGNTGILDTLPNKWQDNPFGLSKQILKECVTGNTGNLLNFANIFTISNYSASTNNDVQQLITGLSAYGAWINNVNMTSGSSALNFLVNNLTLVGQGIFQDAIGVLEQSTILQNLISGSNVNNSLTAFLCNATSINANTCLNNDQNNAIGALSNNVNYTAALPFFTNLQAYILSEQNAVSVLIAQINVGNASPNYIFSTANNLLWQNIQNYQNIIQFIPNTVNALSNYTAGLTAFDCRNIKNELLIFEDHLCFELNYWIYILVVITAVSMMLLYFLTWALCAAARHSTAENIVAAIPEPKGKEDPALDINDREIIPSM